ncbi:regulatory protein RecX [Microbacterium sp. JB110]|uniref:regulatory protein RecX n=1 Tax=Microbacterium sp. JB110 TaxID=2024477 RepID=UPI00097F543A|nr:regulatory protein RecX [Microbacterium sp. JB110]RCS59104.1 regulatory protein RecX [Microbacterium sp. JB110]SJM68801.1 Regulatory protein RecX [Frigoribacterium sp. JB110]
MTANESDDDVAPVIPLFGGRHAPNGASTEPGETAREGGSPRTFPVRRFPAAGAEGTSDQVRTEAPDDADAIGGRGERRDENERDAPAGPEGEAWHTTWRDLRPTDRGVRPAPRVETAERDGVRFVALSDVEDDSAGEVDEAAAKAERKLLRSLGARGLSVSEARGKLRQQEVHADAVEDIIDRLERSGALDDERLAEQIVFQATTHRNEGRRAISQSLQKRGVARDVVDRVIAELPDDDYERALEFARTKARQLARYDDDVALRRLVGQLSRRGYGGFAMSVARRALDEQNAPPSRVRFE